MNESLVANKWYPHYRGPGRSYTNPYPTPQSILREAVGAEEYKFVSETVTTEHIRAAVIMPLDVPFQHLLSEVPWGMSYRDEEWRMIIVSTIDPIKWIELARASGAIGWMKGHHQTCTYNWEPPTTDATGNKIRPPNAPGTIMFGDCKKHYKKKYDLAEVILDLEKRYLTTREIGEKHNITAATVQSIAKRANIKLKPGNPHSVKA
jgi:hypothetical protein